jgi:hypothetical protein
LRITHCCDRLACKRTKFREDYRLNDPADPYIPGSDEIPRLKPIHVGPRNIAFAETDLDRLVGALIEAGGHSESKAKNRKAARTTRVFVTDAPPKQGKRRRSS